MGFKEMSDEKFQKKVLIEDSNGRTISVSKTERAKIRKVLGVTGSVDGMALVRACITYVLTEPMRNY